jgi:hypothetical protein
MPVSCLAVSPRAVWDACTSSVASSMAHCPCCNYSEPTFSSPTEPHVDHGGSNLPRHSWELHFETSDSPLQSWKQLDATTPASGWRALTTPDVHAAAGRCS